VPAAVPYASLTDPQTLNLYGYVRNNPLNRADRDGHCLAAADNSSCLGDEKFEEAQRSSAALTEQFVLPKTPSGLGPEWVKDDGHLAPNGEIWDRADGTRLDFDRGVKGRPKWGGKDHWHVYKPGNKDYDTTQGDKGHLNPGSNAQLPNFPGVPRIQLPPELELNEWAGTDVGPPARSPASVFFPGALPSGLPTAGAAPVGDIPMIWEPVLVP